MTTQSPTAKAAERLARIEANVDRMLATVERGMQDHEIRIRAVEQQNQTMASITAQQTALTAQVVALATEVRELQLARHSQAGVVGFFKWVGAPSIVLTAALLFNKMNGGT